MKMTVAEKRKMLRVVNRMVRSHRPGRSLVLFGPRSCTRSLLMPFSNWASTRQFPKILDLMNVEGLTRENVASHLQKYRLYLKKIDENQQLNMTPDVFGTRDSSYFQMAQLDGFRDFTATRQLPISGLLSRSHLNKFHPTVLSSINLQGIKTSSFIQRGHHQNSSISANLFFFF